MLMLPCKFADECKFECRHARIHEYSNDCSRGNNNLDDFNSGTCPVCEEYIEIFIKEEEMEI